MKKIVVTFVAMAMAFMVSAASTDWKFTAANLKGLDGNAFTGTFELYASGGDLEQAAVLYSGTGKASYANITFSTEALSAGTSYDFYYVITDGDKGSLTSTPKSVVALATGAASVNWGNQATYTGEAGNWKTSGVPEPTTGLLLLIGGTLLALRRKQR